jgi:Methyl-accepting chemotaxis protein
MSNTRNAYLNKTEYELASKSIFGNFVARFRFSGKMTFLLVLVVICTVGGNIWTAFAARDTIKNEIVKGLIKQVTALHGQLNGAYQREPVNFLTIARYVLDDTRWEDDRSGYAFLTDKNGKLVIYPPSKDKEGYFLEPSQVLDKNETINESLSRIGHSGIAEVVAYPYVKPGTTEKILKVAYVKPLGDFLLVSGVYTDNADKAFYSYLQQSAWLVLLIICVMSIAVVSFSKVIGHQVKDVLKELKLIANHDLSKEICVTGNDEFSEILLSIEDARINISKMLMQQQSVSLSLASASEQMNTGMMQVKNAVIEERQQMDSIATAMEELSATVKDVAINANDASNATRNADELAATGVIQIKNVMNSMSNLFLNLTNSAGSVDEVEKKVTLIGSVIDTIRGISEQTNLLALNAAIEAARAGNAGRGFAVVADEVRNLANRTQSATKEITDMIKMLQEVTQKASVLMQNSIDEANTSVDLAKKANIGFESIASQTNELSARSEMIAAAAEQQGLVAIDVTKNLLNVRDSIEETEHVVAELTQASDMLSKHAVTMDTMVKNYRLAS